MMGLFDDIFDDLCPSSLRIPPLQDPFPFPTITDKRPLPLEPNARTVNNIENGTAKLTRRGKALAEAKAIGDTETNELRPIHSTPRKRHKKYEAKPTADFVQLPKPKAKVKEDNLPSFRPISILNELHEPPPSAALFPPITPTAVQAEQRRRPSDGSDPDEPINEVCVDFQNQKERKRLYLRPRTKWSAKETEHLVRGVDMFGVGKWKKILNHPHLSFLEGRKPGDLKDRFRTVMGNHPYQGPEGMPYRTLLGYGTVTEDAESETLTGNRKAPVKKSAKRPWTEEEDESLVKGYQKHGFRWKDIASDSSLALRTRSGNQIRDRFRKRFPEAYDGAPPPLTESVQPGEIRKPSSIDSKTKNITTDVNNRSVGAVDEGDEESNGEEKQPGTLSSTANKQLPSAPVPYGINGLLNTEDEDNRLSSFRYDDWDENVTLPPLLWEDMCPKPMFELD